MTPVTNPGINLLCLLVSSLELEGEIKILFVLLILDQSCQGPEASLDDPWTLQAPGRSLHPLEVPLVQETSPCTAIEHSAAMCWHWSCYFKWKISHLLGKDLLFSPKLWVFSMNLSGDESIWTDQTDLSWYSLGINRYIQDRTHLICFNIYFRMSRMHCRNAFSFLFNVSVAKITTWSDGFS